MHRGSVAKFVCLFVGVVAAGLYFTAHAYRKHNTSWARYAEVITKPIPVASCIALVALRDVSPHALWYSRYVMIGLAFSLVGDVLLAFPTATFLEGVVSFLLGHVFYFFAFNSGDVKINLKPLRIFPFLAHFVFIISFLWDSFGSFRIPGTIYTAVVDFMGWRAAARFGVKGERRVSHYMGLVGVTFFIFSDSFLAIDKWYYPIEGDFSIIMITYWLAQVFISLSVPRSTSEELSDTVALVKKQAKAIKSQ